MRVITSKLHVNSVDHLRRTKPTGVMRAAVASDDRSPICFSSRKVSRRTRKSTSRYWQKKCFPWSLKVLETVTFSFKTMICPTQRFIDHFSWVWDKNMWSPSSPDIKPIYFAILAILESYVSYESYSSAAALKNVFLVSWSTQSHFAWGLLSRQKEVILNSDCCNILAINT